MELFCLCKGSTFCRKWRFFFWSGKCAMIGYSMSCYKKWMSNFIYDDVVLYFFLLHRDGLKHEGKLCGFLLNQTV